MTTDTLKILDGLDKIETTLARIYRSLSEKKAFSQPVRRFWAAIADEELLHAAVFQKIRTELESDPELDFSIELDWQQLKDFADQAKAAVARARADDITESEAYSLGARIEAELNESRFLRLAATGREDLRRQIARVEAETRKHMVIMTNYAKGVK